MSNIKNTYPGTDTPVFPNPSDEYVNKQKKMPWVVPGDYPLVEPWRYNGQNYKNAEANRRQMGYDFYLGGNYDLSIAPPELRDDENFLIGFHRAENLCLQSYEIGFNYRINCVKPDDFADIYKNNDWVLQGYGDACSLFSDYQDIVSPDEFKKILQIVNSGKKWAVAEKSLDETPIKFRNNKFFLTGYLPYSKNIFNAYYMGFQSYMDGKEDTELPYNKHFMKGYNDARELCLIDGVNVPLLMDEDDTEMFRKGKNWAKNGKSLEEAPEEDQYNTYFLNGYDKYSNNSGRNIGR